MTDKPDTFGIKAKIKDLGTAVDDNGWKHYAYEVELTCPFGLSMRTPYRCGMAWDRKPKLDEILYSLQRDCQIVEFDEFDDVFGDMPYSKARELEGVLRRQHRDVQTLLGTRFHAFLEQEYDS